MSKPHVVGKKAVITASMIRAALGDALSKIRSEEGMTWVELGEELGKSDDQAAKYADGSAEMGVTTFYRAKQRWNGRFTGIADKLVDDARGDVSAHHAQSCILKAALALAVALEDGELSVGEIRANRSTLENARDAIDAQLARLTVRAA